MHHVARIGLANGAVATSTTLRRRWTVDGEDRHHLIDPGTGSPVRDGPRRRSTVIAGSAWVAEVLAKAVLLRGSAHPFDLIGGLSVDALAVDDAGRLVASEGFPTTSAPQCCPRPSKGALMTTTDDPTAGAGPRPAVQPPQRRKRRHPARRARRAIGAASVTGMLLFTGGLVATHRTGASSATTSASTTPTTAATTTTAATATTATTAASASQQTTTSTTSTTVAKAQASTPTTQADTSTQGS